MPKYAEAIVQTIRQPILLLDEDLRVDTANRAFYRTFAVQEADVLGCFVFDLGNGQWDIPSLRRMLDHDVLSAGDTVEDYEVSHDFPGIGPKVMIVNARRLRLTERGPARILVAIEDITREREVRKALEAHARDLERSNRDLEQFAYVASHDLQEPLRTVSSFAELLARRYEGQLDDKAQTYIRFMTEAAHRMQHLIKDLLAFSRVTRSDEPAEVAPLEAALAEALTPLSDLIEETGTRVTHDPLPTLRMHPRLIALLFQNLIANAIKYRGDAVPEIHVTAERTRDVWQIEVRDNGPGIDPRYHERIFAIFQRLHPGTHSEGSGIGLSLCRRIAEHHGGTIWVRSAPGEGATFAFTLGGEAV
ncbi:MAG: ATP-binding protein [Trueperaceae bacterium]|nr:ATP-binding protein [Trueperaceae bacterium]